MALREVISLPSRLFSGTRPPAEVSEKALGQGGAPAGWEVRAHRRERPGECASPSSSDWLESEPQSLLREVGRQRGLPEDSQFLDVGVTGGERQGVSILGWERTAAKRALWGFLVGLCHLREDQAVLSGPAPVWLSESDIPGLKKGSCRRFHEPPGLASDLQVPTAG